MDNVQSYEGSLKYVSLFIYCNYPIIVINVIHIIYDINNKGDITGHHFKATSSSGSFQTKNLKSFSEETFRINSTKVFGDE